MLSVLLSVARHAARLCFRQRRRAAVLLAAAWALFTLYQALELSLQHEAVPVVVQVVHVQKQLQRHENEAPLTAGHASIGPKQVVVAAGDSNSDAGRSQPSKEPQSGRSDRLILYLTQLGRLGALSAGLRFLFKNFNDRFQYRVVILHEGDLNISIVRESLHFALSAEQLALIDTYLVPDFNVWPPGLTEATANRERIATRGAFPGYSHMSTFWFKKVFNLPLLRNVNYFLRQDSDSYILSPITYDPFDFMERHGVRYGYVNRHDEGACCAMHLYQFALTYVKAFGVGGENLSSDLSWLVNETSTSVVANSRTQNPKDQQPWLYYTNFEIIHVPSFRDHPDVQRFLHAAWTEPMHGIYTRRWGDAPLRFLTVHLHPHLHQHLVHYVMLCELLYVQLLDVQLTPALFQCFFS